MDGDRIREARERRHLTQKELADILDVSARSVGSWERGGEISHAYRARLRAFFGSDLDELPGPVQATKQSSETDVEAIVTLAREMARLHQELAEKNRTIAELRERLAQMEAERNQGESIDLRELAQHYLDHPESDAVLVGHLGELRDLPGVSRSDALRLETEARYQRRKHLLGVLEALPPAVEKPASQ